MGAELANLRSIMLMTGYKTAATGPVDLTFLSPRQVVQFLEATSSRADAFHLTYAVSSEECASQTPPFIGLHESRPSEPWGGAISHHTHDAFRHSCLTTSTGTVLCTLRYERHLVLTLITSRGLPKTRKKLVLLGSPVIPSSAIYDYFSIFLKGSLATTNINT